MERREGEEGGRGERALPGDIVADAATAGGAAAAVVLVGKEGEREEERAGAAPIRGDEGWKDEGEGAEGKVPLTRGEREEEKEEGEAAKAGLPLPPTITDPPPELLLLLLLLLLLPTPPVLPMLTMAGLVKDATCGGRGTGM